MDDREQIVHRMEQLLTPKEERVCPLCDGKCCNFCEFTGTNDGYWKHYWRIEALAPRQEPPEDDDKSDPDL